MTSDNHRADGGTPRPQQSKMAISFMIGSLVGLWLAMPAVRPFFQNQLTGHLDAVGRTLAIGVLLMVIVTLGMVVLFQLFMFMDR